MKNRLTMGVVFMGLALAANAQATNFGNNITIFDNRALDSNSWYNGTGVGAEDNEVEPGMQTNQGWDLEGFFLSGTELTVVGGFDFINGHPDYSQYQSGDIFLDTTGDATYGDSGMNLRNGYDYVLDLDFAALTFDVFAIDDSASLLDVASYNQQKSSPWRYGSGGEKINTDGALSFSYFNFGNSDVNALGFNGDETNTHNAFTVDLASLGLGADFGFTSHFTMGCGNDNLMGSAPVPEPATMFLLGSGLVGLAGMKRRKRQA